MQSWAEEEFRGASLGDKRLNRRLIEVARTLGDKPTASIPSACGGWADTQATYRFFDQASEDKQNLGWEDVLAVQWRLITNRPIHSGKDAEEIIDWYRCRWEIETFFHTLKNGYKVEGLQLGSIAKIELALAVYMVSAWRLARLIQRARVEPELDASLLFSEDEWKSAYILDKKPIPKKAPKLRELIRLIAKRGGFLGRKGDGEPGVKTLWQGFMEIRTFASGLAYMRSSNAI